MSCPVSVELMERINGTHLTFAMETTTDSQKAYGIVVVWKISLLLHKTALSLFNSVKAGDR